MKQQRLRFRAVTLLVILLLGGSAAYGVYSVTVYGGRWASSSHNTRTDSAQSSVIPGDILDRNGVVIATTDEDGNRVYQSDLLSRASLVHLLGDSEGNVSNAVESFQAGYLLGLNSTLTEQAAALLTGTRRKGDTVQLTVDSALCTDIVSFWRSFSKTKDRCGAVIVMNYKTGEILALVSLPVYDPSNVTDAVKTSTQHPFWNRALQSTLAPGSTFKIITAACALENLSDAEERVFTCTGALQVTEEHAITDFDGEVHGEIFLSRAFRVSCNNTFAQIAQLVGDSALRRTAEDFGFNDNFLFSDLVVENSTYPTKDRTAWQIAWSGAGQSTITATPMHMCMVASAVANGGVMMEPRLVQQVTGSASGTERYTGSNRMYRTACSPEIASVLQGYMKDTVARGTGTRAAVSGLTVCGKTGSAEASVDGKEVTNAWFVGYIASDKLPYACCVLVEEGGSGGSVAAPVAQEVFSYLKERYGS